MWPGEFLQGVSGEIVIFRRNSQHYRESEVPDRQSDAFYRRKWASVPTPPKMATLSRIRPSRALGPVIWAIRPPAARQNTVLSERPWLLSRARGGVRLGNARQYRGIDVTDGARDGDLRQIRRCRFSNPQHSRGFDAPARGRGGDLRHIRRCRFRNRQHSRGFDAPDREKADTIQESQSRAPILPCFIGPLGEQVVRFAGGTPFLPRRTAKSRHAREPGRPVCVRHAGPGALERKSPAPRRPGGAGGGGAGKPREHESGKSTSEIDT